MSQRRNAHEILLQRHLEYVSNVVRETTDHALESVNRAMESANTNALRLTRDRETVDSAEEDVEMTDEEDEDRHDLDELVDQVRTQTFEADPKPDEAELIELKRVVDQLKNPREFEAFFITQVKEVKDKAKWYSNEYVGQSMFILLSHMCRYGYMNGLAIICLADKGLFRFLDASHKLCQICAQYDQLEMLKHLIAYLPESVYECLSSINLKEVYDKGYYDIFIYVLNMLKHHSDFSFNKGILVDRLNDLKVYIEVKSGYMGYVANNGYLSKVKEILFFFNAMRGFLNKI